LKEKVSPAVIVVVIVVVVAIVGFIGMKVFGKANRPMDDPAMKAKYDSMTKAMPNPADMDKAMRAKSGSGMRRPGGAPQAPAGSGGGTP